MPRKAKYFALTGKFHNKVVWKHRAAQQINGREGETATFLKRSLVSLTFRVAGFAPRHLNRCASSRCYGKRFMKICFISILSFVALLFAPGIGFACSCSLPPMGKTEKQLIKLERKKSQAVFVGEVTEIIAPKTASGEEAWTAEVRFKVLQTWKGITTETVSVFTANRCCICGYKFEVGERYLIYAYSSDKNLGTNFCTRTKTLSEANADLKVLGKNKVPKT